MKYEIEKRGSIKELPSLVGAGAGAMDCEQATVIRAA